MLSEQELAAIRNVPFGGTPQEAFSAITPLVQTVSELQAQLAEREKELAEARRDTDRLDWMERTRCGLLPGMPQYKHDYWFLRCYDARNPFTDSMKTIRATIDAARAAEGTGECR